MKNQRLLIMVCILLLLSLACGGAAQGTPGPIPTLASDPLAEGDTVYGFFPSPPEISIESVMAHYKALGEHADVVLLQQNIPWKEFVQGAEAESQAITDIHNQYILAHQNGLEVLFVVDPLNGLNRREFYNLPFGWKAAFSTPEVRRAFTNYTLRIVREFHPPYLGLASEINTYADAFPDDFPHYLSLYQEVYDLVKAESPKTQVFVTFQWEDLNNLIPVAAEGRWAYQTNWDQVEAFEPRLDLWVISSYPFIAFKSGAEIPKDYYSALLSRTSKPLAVAEGGFTSQPVGELQGAPQDQVDYLEAIHSQIGSRLTFWIYLLLNDFNLESYAKIMRQQGNSGDVSTLGMFAFLGLSQMDGTPKPALAVWDGYRNSSK